MRAHVWPCGLAQVTAAMRQGVHLLLIHEVPGARLGDNEARHACIFEHFFEDHTTPKHLLKAGIYNTSIPATQVEAAGHCAS